MLFMLNFLSNFGRAQHMSSSGLGERSSSS